MAQMRQAAGLVAALLVASLGVLLVPGALILGIAFLVLGVATIVLLLWRIFEQRRREDPYSLEQLWERPLDPLDDPELLEEPIPDDGSSFCHRCGHAVPPPFTHCPECGGPLG